MLTELQLADLVSVATHEAAHAWTAIRFGDVAPRIHVHPHTDYRRGYDSFRGWCAPTIRFQPAQRRLFALAGAVAQLVLIDPNVTAQAAYHALLAEQPITLTDIDARMAGYFDARDIAACLTLVRRLWPWIEWTADALVQHTIERL